MVPPNYSSCQWEMFPPPPPTWAQNFSKVRLLQKKNPWFFWHPSRNTKKQKSTLDSANPEIFISLHHPQLPISVFFVSLLWKKAAKLLFLDFSNDICGGTLSLRLRLDSFYQRLGSHEGPAFRPTTTYFWHTILRDHRRPKKWWERNTLKFIRRIHFRNERCIDGVFEFGGSNCEPECVVVELVRNLAVSRVSPFF